MYGPAGPSLFELARQALSSTDRGYDLLAPKFDATPFRTPDAVIAPVLDALGDVDEALDLCCGTGAATRPLKALCRRAVVGVDRSVGMLAECRRRTADAPGAPLSLVRADALDLPFVERFDAIVSFGAFGHVLAEDHPRLFASVRRALRPGGRFAFVAAPRPPLFSKERVLSRAFNAAMRVRNALIRPRFVMYYLGFHLPDVGRALRASGFDVVERGASFPAQYQRFRVVVAARPG